MLISESTSEEDRKRKASSWLDQEEWGRIARGKLRNRVQGSRRRRSRPRSPPEISKLWWSGKGFSPAADDRTQQRAIMARQMHLRGGGGGWVKAVDAGEAVVADEAVALQDHLSSARGKSPSHTTTH